MRLIAYHGISGTYMRRELWILSLLIICLALLAGVFFARAIDPTKGPAPAPETPQVADASRPAATVPDPFAPLIEWNFDHAAGNLVPDATGHGYDALMQGDFTLVRYASGRQALSLNGSGDNNFWHGQAQNCGMSIAKRLDRAFDQLSVEAWVRKDPGPWMPVLYRGSWDDASGFGLYMEWSAGKAAFGHYGGNGVGSERVVQDGRWHQVVGTMSPAADGGYLYRIFVDGELDAEQKGSLAITAASPDAGILLIAYPNSSGADNPYKGDLGRIALYDVALTPAAIKAHFEAQRPAE